MEQLNRMNLNHLSTFYAVARKGSFTAAARDLGFPKSAVSLQVRQLEERLGTRLLQRTTRKVALTDIGEVFLAHCERVMTEAEDAEKAVSEYTAEPRGLLRVGVPMTFARTFLAPVLPILCEKYPHLNVELVIPGGRLDLVENLLDVSIRIGGKLADSSYVLHKLGELPQGLFASRKYLARNPAPKVPADLARHTLISTGRTPTGWQWKLRDQMGKEQEVRFEPRVAIPDPVLAHLMTQSGVGIGLLPAFLTKNDDKLVPILKSWKLAPIEVFALHPARKLTPLKVRVFLEELQKNLVWRKS